MRKWSSEELTEIMEYFEKPSGIFCAFWNGAEISKAKRVISHEHMFVKRDKISQQSDCYPVYLNGQEVADAAAKELGKSCDDAIEIDNYRFMSVINLYPLPWIA
jgi:hypothetical protein